MASVCLELLAEPRIDTSGARHVRRELERTCGVEAITISVKRQLIVVDYNSLYLDGDALGEKMADLGFVVRPVKEAKSPCS